MNPIFTGTINSGKLHLDKSEQFKQYLASFPTGKRVEVTVEKQTRKRSNNQNRYYWSCVVGEIAKHTGHDPEQIHELLKFKFAPRWHFMEVMIGNAGIPTSTTRLDTLEFVEYTEKCRLWANDFLNLNIPLPNEVNV